MTQNEGLKLAIKNAGSGNSFPAVSLIRPDPGLAAVMSKLVSGNRAPTYNERGMRAPEAPNNYQMSRTSDRVAQNIVDTKTALQMLPDLEHAFQVLISSVLAPKDLNTTELTYIPPEGLVPADVASGLVARLRRHFEQDYKIKPMLNKILQDVLRDTGSYPIAVLPENTVDEAINGAGPVAMESLSEVFTKEGELSSLGLLGPVFKNQPDVVTEVPRYAFESIVNDSRRQNQTIDPRVRLSSSFEEGVETFITVTDNYNLLKVPKIQERIRRERINQVIHRGKPVAAGVESVNSGNVVPTAMNGGAVSFSSGAVNIDPKRVVDRQLDGKIFKAPKTGYVPVGSLKSPNELSRNAVGNPLIMHLPSESVLPVYVPGTPEHHIGYFVLIDPSGYPITKSDSLDHYNQMGQRLNSSGSLSSAMMTKLQSQVSGFNNTYDHEFLDYSNRVFGEMMEKELLSRLRNGLYNGSCVISNKEEVYRVMFARALSQQNTQILFIPAEMMTYIAFRYNPDGTGKSLMDDQRILNNMRAVMSFSNIHTSLRNSVGRTEVKLKIPENDPDPIKTIERAQHEVLRTRNRSFIQRANRPGEIADLLASAGLEFTYEGHPGLPDVGIEFNEKATSYPKADTDLEEDLRKRGIMALGMSPETVDATLQAEHAISVVTNNLMLAKHVTQLQDMFTPQLSNHMRQVALHSEALMTDMRQIIADNYQRIVDRYQRTNESGASVGITATANTNRDFVINELLYTFLSSFEVMLPRPNSVTLENQLNALDTYSKALDAWIDVHINADFFNTTTAGDISEHLETVRAAVKSHYLRKWFAENDVLSELNELISLDEEGKPQVDVYHEMVTHIGIIAKTVNFMLNDLEPIKRAANIIEKERQNADNTDGDNAPSADTGDGGDDAGGDGGDGGFGDDFGGDFGGGDDGGSGGDEGESTDAGGESNGETPEDDEDPNLPF